MLHEDGGEHINRQAGKAIRIYGVERVYCLNMTAGDVPDASGHGDQLLVCDHPAASCHGGRHAIARPSGLHQRPVGSDAPLVADSYETRPVMLAPGESELGGCTGAPPHGDAMRDPPHMPPSPVHIKLREH